MTPSWHHIGRVGLMLIPPPRDEYQQRRYDANLESYRQLVSQLAKETIPGLQDLGMLQSAETPLVVRGTQCRIDFIVTTKMIGSGAYGMVFEAIDPKTG